MHRDGGGRGKRGRAGGRQGSGRGSSYRETTSSAKILILSGFKQRPQLSELGKLLSSKTKRRIRWSSCQVRDNSVELKFDHDGDARAIANLKNLDFKGANLTISFQSNLRLSPEQQNSVLIYVGKSYNAASKFLDLARATSAISGVPVDFNDRGFVDYICSIVSENCSDVRTIRLDFNGISTLSSFQGLADAAPDLVNLSLANNKIGSFDELSYLSAYSNSLQELMLANNHFPQLPIEMHCHLIHSHFKKLKMLDQNPVHPLVTFGVPVVEVNLPKDISRCFDPPEVEPFTQSIITPFFEQFDHSRDSLLELYLDNSCFSLAVHDDSLSAYLPMSRNLKLLRSWRSRSSLCSRGKFEIISTFRKMPATQHLAHTFSVDVTAIEGTRMLICVSGQFMEGMTSLRSFARSFLLAQVPNRGFVILNDQLSVSLSSTSVKESPKPVVLHSPASLLPEQQQIVMQLAQQADVPLEVAFQAYIGQNGDPNSALLVLRQASNASKFS